MYAHAALHGGPGGGFQRKCIGLIIINEAWARLERIREHAQTLHNEKTRAATLESLREHAWTLRSEETSEQLDQSKWESMHDIVKIVVAGLMI